MKLFLKIIAGVLLLFIIIGIGLNLYFTDERLKQTLLPHLNEAVDRPVEVESMSLTFFRTFPRPGLNIKNMNIPGESESDTLLALDELVTAVELWPLLRNRINISEIRLVRPKFTYVVFPDSTTNIDFLFDEPESEVEESEGYTVNIPFFEVTEGQFGYRDLTSATDVLLSGFNADISLSYDELITSSIELKIGGLTASVNGTSYVEKLPLSLSQESIIDLEKELITLKEGTFGIRGLNLNLTGSVGQWSNTPVMDLNFNSSSDNFGELLRLVPEEYESHVNELETRGNLTLSGSVKGTAGGDELPVFDLTMAVSDGYLKNPDLPEPVQDIQLELHADNKLVTVKRFTANAGENNINLTGELHDPLEENGAFILDLNGDVNLSTVNQFYDISEFDLEQMEGLLTVDASASGDRENTENATFNAVINLANGSLKYADVPEAIQNINIDAKASHNLVTINSLNLEAAQNSFSLKGTVGRPLDENNRTVDLNTSLKFNLATIKNFYPINEDTLRMSGMLTAQAALRGKADQIERSVQSGSINLTNGFIEHQKLGKPFRDITFESILEGGRMTIVKANFRTGENNLNASGYITDYLSDDRSVNIKLQGQAKLSEIANYYELRPTIEKLAGDANLNLMVKGPVNDPTQMAFDGNLNIKNVSMEGDSLVQPVSDLNGELNLNPKKASLESLIFRLGESDITLSGSLVSYMEFLKPAADRQSVPHLTGAYSSNFLNLDELIDWDEETPDKPIPIDLPGLTSSLKADVSEMLITGVRMNNLKANATTDPDKITLEKASIELFEGQANGSFVWEVPQPDRTSIIFNGSLKGLRAESFFEEYAILGEKSDFHEYVSGAFNANVDYYSELNVYLDPLIETSTMSGSFGMSKARLKGHPIQIQIAEFLKVKELQNLALDEWKSTFILENSVFTFKNLRLTSGDIGMELNGQQHLVKETIDYQMRLYLPERFKGTIASVITKQATDALTQENGTIMIPLRITGTHQNPSVTPDQEIISPIVKEYLQNKAGNVIKKLFGGDNN